MQIFGKTNFDFVSKRKLFLTLSAVVIIGGIALSGILGLDYGIDFEGGIEMVTEFEKPVNTELLRDAVTGLGILGAEIKTFGAPNQYIIRIKQTGTPVSEVAETINKAIPESEMKLLKVDEIGPKIGSELRNQAFLAMFLALIAMLLYIAFRFEFVYGLGAVIAILHDIVVTFIVALLIHKSGLINMEINITFLAAMLTVVGYSISNTVIIFDRVRENNELMKGKGISQIVNTSVNETLNRTVITVFTMLLVLVTLILFGGPVLLPFAVIMTLGTTFGVYSSIYISSSFVIWYIEKKQIKKA
jgi:preprotein translocase subunit SecF